MDLYEAKDRIAVALVESIFRRARYQVRPFQADAAMLRFMREDSAPDFHATLLEDGSAREFLIDVTYRPFVDPFIALENQRRESSVFVLARRHWPALRSVLVTDHPDRGRSCFQTVVVDFTSGDRRLRTVDLAAAAELGIFAHNVADHEQLLLRIFALLLAERGSREPSRLG
jgi:hypothetical protein